MNFKDLNRKILGKNGDRNLNLSFVSLPYRGLINNFQFSFLFVNEIVFKELLINQKLQKRPQKSWNLKWL